MITAHSELPNTLCAACGWCLCVSATIASLCAFGLVLVLLKVI